MYPPETRDAILERISEDVSIRQICEMDGMPDKATVMRWLDSEPEFATKYAKAKAKQAHAIIESFSDLEDRVLAGELKPDAAKVVLWSRQWRAAKLNPKVYGEKVEQTHELGDSVKEIVRSIIRAA